MKTKLIFMFFCIFSIIFFWYCGDSPSITQSEQPMSLKKGIPGPMRQGDDYLSIHAMALNVTDLDGYDYVWPLKWETKIYVRAYVNSNAKTGNYVADFEDQVLPTQHFVTDSVWIYDGPENSGEIENIKFKITEFVVRSVWIWYWQYSGSWYNHFWTEEVDLYNPGYYTLDVITGDGEYLMIRANLLHGGS